MLPRRAHASVLLTQDKALSLGRHPVSNFGNLHVRGLFDMPLAKQARAAATQRKTKTARTLKTHAQRI